MNIKKIIFIFFVILFVFQLIMMNKQQQLKASEIKPHVVASTFSLYDIMKHILEDTAKVETLLPFGVDTHSYEPTPKQVAKLYSSDLVVYSGAGLERWCSSFEFKNLAINMSEHVNLKKLESHAEHDHGHDHEISMAQIDPHYWLDIDNMIKAAIVIKDELSKLLPKHKKLYEKNTTLYIDMLKKLDNDYKNKLATCDKDTIIVNHNAYSYLSSRYDFNVEALSGLSPEAEPSAKSMISLIEHVKDSKISTIFFESFANDKAIKSIADEAKVSVKTLHPIGNITADEAKKSITYEKIMRDNLEKISKALECR